MFTPLCELYQDPTIAEAASCQRDMWSHGNVDGNLRLAGALVAMTAEAAIVEHVEALPEYDYADSRTRAARLLGCLPAPLLFGNFGEQITAWTFANDLPHRRERIGSMLESEGYDSDLLAKAQLLAWEERIPPRGRDILKQHAVAEGILGGALDKVDLPGLLAAAALPDITLSEKRLGDYTLIPLRAEKGDFRPGGRVREWEGREKAQKPGVSYSLWLDTPTGFALSYKGTPQAVVGVAAHGADELQIHELQRWWGKTYDPADPEKLFHGIKPPRGLVPLDWERVMVGVTAELAAALGKDAVGIRAGSRIPSADCKITHAQAVQMYDVPAQRLQFMPGEDGNWHKPVSELQRA